MTRKLFVPLAALLSACVTINVYFPAAAAEKAADRVIDEVWGGQAAPAPAAPPAPGVLPENPSPPTSRKDHREARDAALALLEFVFPTAQAAEPNLELSSPESKRLTDSMEARFIELSAYYASGAVGLAADGYVAVRDPNLIPLPDRNKVRTLVANENADRAALYRELAQANGQPQWETQIRSVFGQRWTARAKSGWWVQSSGGEWSQKP